MSRRIVSFVVGQDSRKIGTLCRKCEKPFKEGDEITTRGVKQVGQGTVKNYHTECWNRLFQDA